MRASCADAGCHGRRVGARCTEQLGDGGQQKRRVPEWRERNEDRAAVRLLREQPRELQRESRLPGASRPDDGKDARLALVPDGNRPEKLALTAEEGGCRDRKVDRAGRSKRRERRVAELEDPYEAVEVLDAMLPRSVTATWVERSHRVGSVMRTCPPWASPATRAHDGRPPRRIPRSWGSAFPCEAPSDLDRADCERVLPVEGRIHRLAGGREGDEERVALRVDLDAAVRGEGRAQCTTVLGQRLRVRLRPERVKQPRRALDVGEEERDRAGRELGAHGLVVIQHGAVTRRARALG